MRVDFEWLENASHTRLIVVVMPRRGCLLILPIVLLQAASSHRGVCGVGGFFFVCL